MCRMPKVCLQALEIVEVDRGYEVCRVYRRLLVTSAVSNAAADPHMTDGGNLAKRPFEGRDERLSIGVRQIGARFHQDEMCQHALSVSPFAAPVTLGP